MTSATTPASPPEAPESPESAQAATQPQDEAPAWLDDLTPRQIVAELDKYIVGQADAKKAVAIALRNRWRRQRVDEDLREEILPNNLIMIGPTGVGKTEIARRLARLAGSPFVKVEASKFTEVGYVGRDVESMVRDLVDTAVSMVRNAREDEVEGQAAEMVEERLLDLLLPEPSRPAPKNVPPEIEEKRRNAVRARLLRQIFGPDGPSEADGDESGGPADRSQEARFDRTREKLRKLLREGKLEKRMVEVNVRQGPAVGGMMFPVGGMEGMDLNFTEMLQDLLPKRSKVRDLTVAEARRVLMQEELDHLVDMDEVINEALDRTEDMGIIFLDELDKIAGGRGARAPT